MPLPLPLAPLRDPLSLAASASLWMHKTHRACSPLDTCVFDISAPTVQVCLQTEHGCTAAMTLEPSVACRCIRAALVT